MRILGVLPEIPDIATGIGTVGDTVIGFVNGQRLIVETLIALIALQAREGPVVLTLHPFQGLFALDLFEPDARIIVRIDLDDLAPGRGPGCFGGHSVTLFTGGLAAGREDGGAGGHRPDIAINSHQSLPL